MKNKNLILGAVLILIVVALVFISSKKGDLLIKTPDLILKAETSLSLENKAFVEKRLSLYEKQLSELTETASIIDKVNLYFVISTDYRALGEYGKARDVLDKAMMLDPKNSNLMQTYSSLLSVMGDKKGAMDYIDKAISLYGAESNYWLWKIELEKERATKGIELESVYKNALQATSGDLNIVIVYARFLEGEKRYDEAILEWQKAIKLYPQNNLIYQGEIDRISSND